MTNPIIQTDLAEILGQLNQKLDKLSEEVTELKTEVKVGFAEVKGEIKALDAQVEQLDKRITNSEFTNRGILIGIVVIILGGAAKIFGLAGN
jgi:predicted RNase H-like nuclease (RuvC/YqgF family)